MKVIQPLLMEIIQMYVKPFLQEFCRKQWTSARVRCAWESRIQKVSNAFLAAEIASVEVGVRQATLQDVHPQNLARLSQQAAKRGLVVTPLAQKSQGKNYTASSVELRKGEPWTYRAVITTPSASVKFAQAWNEEDSEVMGRMLGYPKCCRDRFQDTWNQGSVDPTWDMDDKDGGPIEANILLRWLGVRLIPHLPCGFRCKETVEFGKEMRSVMSSQEAEWATQLLSMPMKWSSLFGIGEVVTPIFTLNFRSDVSHELRTFSHYGTFYPEESARGLTFPYKTISISEEERLWKDNGFSSRKAMDEAHEVIARVAPPSPQSVLDLGCGNGVLARRLAGTGKAVGVELDPARANRAKKRLDEVVTGDLFDAQTAKSGDLVVFMPGRLFEADGNRDGFIQALSMQRDVLIYMYGDWVDKYGSLQNLCNKSGLKGSIRNGAGDDRVKAGMWSAR